MIGYDSLILGISAILIAACLLLPVSRALKLPFIIVLAVFGLALGTAIQAIEQAPEAFHFVNSAFLLQIGSMPVSSETFLQLLLPILLFQTSIASNVRALIADWPAILVMAVGAVILTTLFGAASIHLAGIDSIILCLLIAAIVATTDPVSVIAIFREAGVSTRLTSLIEGESLLNDAAAIAIFVLLLELRITATDADAIKFLMSFFGGFAGGLCFGMLFGWIASLLLDRLDQAGPAEITVSIATAFFSYTFCSEYLGVSGVIAVVFTGLTYANLGRRRISHRRWQQIESIWQQIGFWASCMIVVLAMMLATKDLLNSNIEILYLLFALIVGTLLARALVLFIILPAISWFNASARFPANLGLVAWWGGLRGAVTLALALSVAEHPQIDTETGTLVTSLAAGFVLFTLFVQGTTLRALVRIMGLDQLSKFDLEIGERVQLLAKQNLRSQMKTEAKRLNIEWQFDNLSSDSNQASVSSRDALNMALEFTTSQEVELILKSRSDRLLSRAVAAQLVAESLTLKDAARTDGLDGYRYVSNQQLKIPRVPRSYIILHRHLGLDHFLAGHLAHQFDRAIARHRILTQLGTFVNGRTRNVLGDSTAQSILKFNETRLNEINRQLDAIRLQYPGFWQRLTHRHLKLIFHRMEYEFYSRLNRDGLLSHQLWQSLRHQVLAAHKAEQIMPDLDLNPDLATMITQTPFFASLDNDRIRRLARSFSPLLTFPGEYLIKRGQHGDKMYFVESGALEVITDRQRVRLGSGEIVGELALLTRKPRNADVVSLTFCRLLCLSRDIFRNFLHENPDLMAEMRKVAKRRLRHRSFEKENIDQEDYFPMQNRENIASRTSSADIRPES